MYKGLNVLTGKDLSHDAKAIPHTVLNHHETPMELVTYEINGTPVWLYDLVAGDMPLSISSYKQAAEAAIADIRSRKKLPILIGGSGLYIRSVVDHIDTIEVPKNELVRKELTSLPITELQQRLQNVDAKKFEAMNDSDNQNPRRLIRAIEIGMAKKNKSVHMEKLRDQSNDVLWIGLSQSKENIAAAIAARVEARWMGGALSEVKSLESIKSDIPRVSSLGIEPIMGYLSGVLSEDEAKKQWIAHEISYAKRQMIWFKKNAGIEWYDCAATDMPNAVEMRVASWYTQHI
jgi:tRNA dimethylallyltransferase